MVVAVAVIERKQVVAPGLEVAQGELTKLVGFGDTLHREGGDGGVAEVGVRADNHPLRRLESLGLEHHS